MDPELNLPKSAEICRAKGVQTFAMIILGSTVGHLIDCGLSDLEVLTVIEDLLKMRAVIADKAMQKALTKQIKITGQYLAKDEG